MQWLNKRLQAEELTTGYLERQHNCLHKTLPTFAKMDRRNPRSVKQQSLPLPPTKQSINQPVSTNDEMNNYFKYF